ncbi:MAG TPA: hypothetical protein V6D12_22115 [Candidatus Obscuribacterales bacterium]
MLTRTKVSVATLGAAFICLGTVGAAKAVTLVAPSSQASQEGNADSVQPLNVASRLQQVYAASEFSSISGPLTISGLSWRLDGVSTIPINFTPTNLQISLSTTSKAVDGLSQAFNNNIGANNTVVYNGLFTPTTSNSPSVGVKPFDINIAFTTPFVYNPTAGNLLVDVKNFSPGQFLTLDAQRTMGDSISTVVAIGTNSSLGIRDTKGLVTQFTINSGTPTAVPFEFSPTLGIVLAGVLGGITQLRSKLQKSKIAGSSFSNNQ